MTTDLNGYRYSIIAASQASEAAHLMTLAAIENELPPRDALEKLVDALKVAIEGFGDDDIDNQLLGALEKWLSEQGL